MQGRPSGFVRPPSAFHLVELVPGRPMAVSATGADTAGAVGVIEETVVATDGPPLHVHHACEEVLVVLAGEFTFQVGEQTSRGPAGTVAFIPRGVAHTGQNSGPEPGRILILFMPAGFENFLMDYAATPAEERGPGLVQALSAKYQTEFIGPRLADMTG